MSNPHDHSACRLAATWLEQVAMDRLRRPIERLREHALHCPHCRQRLLGVNRLQMGLTLMQTQVHAPDLLMRANRRAIAALSYTVRDLPQAEVLRHAQPKFPWRQRMARYGQSISHAAACLAVMLCLRLGIFQSVTKLQEGTQRMAQEYQAHHIGDALNDDGPGI